MTIFTSTESPGIDESQAPPGFTGAYLLAHFGKSLFWHSGEILFAYFLTEACGLSANRMGWVLAISLMASAFCDIAVGRMLSGRVRDTASAARMQFLGAAGSTAAFLAFAGVGLLQSAWRMPAALVCLVVFRLVYSLYDVPQNAILAFAARTPRQRAHLSALRLVFSGLANLAIAAAFAPLLQGQGQKATAEHFEGLSVALASVAMLSAAVLLALGRRRAGGMAHATPEASRNTMTAILWPLMGASLVFSVGTSVFSRLEPYFASFALVSRLNSASLMICVSLGTLLSQPVWALITERTSLRRAQMGASVILIGGAALFFMVGRQGGLGAGGSGFLYGFGSGGVMMILWAQLAQVCAARPETTTQTFGLFTFFSKAGLAVSALGLGWAMRGFDYRNEVAPVAALMAFVPVAAVLVCQVLLASRSIVKPRL